MVKRTIIVVRVWFVSVGACRGGVINSNRGDGNSTTLALDEPFQC